MNCDSLRSFYFPNVLVFLFCFVFLEEHPKKITYGEVVLHYIHFSSAFSRLNNDVPVFCHTQMI